MCMHWNMMCNMTIINYRLVIQCNRSLNESSTMSHPIVDYHHIVIAIDRHNRLFAS